MKAILCTLCALFTISAMAETTSFNIEIGLNDLASGETVFSYNCDVKQTLTWENQFNFFKCTDNNNQTISVTSVPTDIGYSYESRRAFTSWHLSGRNGLVTQILAQKGLNIEINATDLVKIFYSNYEPKTTSDEYLLEGENKVFSFTISANGYLF